MSQSLNPVILKVLKEHENIVEEGWNILKHLRAAKQIHLHDKECFFAGAAYMFDAMLSAATANEQSEEDLQILTKLSAELMRFNEQFNRKVRLK